MNTTIRRSMDLSRAAFGRRMRQRFTEPSALRTARRRAEPAVVDPTIGPDETGRAEQGERLIDGVFDFAGQTVRVPLRSLWRTPAPSRRWLEQAHSFEWLADLAALGDDDAYDAAAMLAAEWTERNQSYDPLIWSPDVVVRRLRAWLLHAPMLAPRAESADAAAKEDAEGGDAPENTAAPSGRTRARAARKRVESQQKQNDAVMKALWAQADWTLKRAGETEPGLTQIRGAAAAALAAIAIDGWESRRGAAATALEDAIAASLLEDGGVVTRSPEDACLVFSDLQHLADRYDALALPRPEALDAALPKMARALRFFRTADGGLPRFHGARELNDGRLDALLTHARIKTEPTASLPFSGYERMVGGRVSVLMDCGAAATGPAAERAHASALAIELCSGRRRVIVNCGSGAALDADWRRALRAEPAQSTVTIDDEPFVETQAGASGASSEVEQALIGPPNVQVERKEERNGVWSLASHDGYVASHGVRVMRRLFLSADGGDFRGEDGFYVNTPADERAFAKRLAKLPRAQREDGFLVTARFHLHPDARAAVVADGEAITLRLPHGEVWVMRQAGGAVALAPSVYVGASETPRASEQIIVTSSLDTPGLKIRWAFRRVGELNQLPKDFRALLSLVEDGEDAFADEPALAEPS